MRIDSIRTYARTLLFCTLVGVGLLVIGCDSGGSNGGPSWTGNWEVQSVDGSDIPDGKRYFSITEEEVTIIEDRSNIGVVCEKENITNVDGNEITTDTGTSTVDVSDDGNTLRIDDNDGGTVTAKSVDSVPDCPEL